MVETVIKRLYMLSPVGFVSEASSMTTLVICHIYTNFRGC